MKKILIIHTNYREYGGEDVAVSNEFDFLSKHFEVEKLIYNNSDRISFNELFSFFTQSNRKSNLDLKSKLNKFKPDVVYVHNTWFKAGLGIFKILEKKDITTVVKLHNFRYSCTRSFFADNHFKNDEVCKACGLNRKHMGFFNKYFSDSFLKSFLIINYGKKYFNILKNKNFKIFVLTRYQKEKLAIDGIDKEKINIFPNFIKIQNENKSEIKEKVLVYAGRISKEKGLEELIVSFIKSRLENYELKIIGEGPLLNELVHKYNQQNINFLGSLENYEVLDIIKRSTAVVTATKLLEGQPTILCEASSFGIPSIYPRSGGIEEFFPKSNILSFRQYDYDDLLSKLEILKNEELLISEGFQNKKFIQAYLNASKLVKEFEKFNMMPNE